MSNPENPPAFPISPAERMTLRDYFAGQALAGISAEYWGGNQRSNEAVLAARDCYKLADAMLSEREKGGAE